MFIQVSLFQMFGFHWIEKNKTHTHKNTITKTGFLIIFQYTKRKSYGTEILLLPMIKWELKLKSPNHLIARFSQVNETKFLLPH